MTWVEAIWAALGVRRLSRRTPTVRDHPLNSSEMVTLIHDSMPSIKRGALRVWGVWFGKPYDNWMTIVDCYAEDSCLCIRFDQNEVLRIYGADGLSCSEKEFKINRADKVRFDWHSYGSEKDNDVRYIELASSNGGLETTVIDDGVSSIRRRDRTNLAVEIL